MKAIKHPTLTRRTDPPTNLGVSPGCGFRSKHDWALMKVVSESMQLFLTTDQELLTQVKHGLGSSQNRVGLVDSTVLAIQLETNDLQNLVRTICDFIPQSRWGSVRCCTVPSDQQPTAGQLMRSESLDLIRKKVMRFG